ncbi:MAG: hypothetical protein Q7U04_17100, partial [Bacteriovorax sp.]|nr:hypothetical protein [Bacteriovorax sp.]
RPLVNHITACVGNIMIDMGDEENKKYHINVDATGATGVSVAIDGSTATANVTNSVKNYYQQIKHQGEKVISKLETEPDLSLEDKEYIESYVNYFIAQSQLPKPNIRIGQKIYKEFMGCVDAAKMTSEMVSVMGTFGPLILQLLS